MVYFSSCENASLVFFLQILYLILLFIFSNKNNNKIALNKGRFPVLTISYVSFCYFWFYLFIFIYFVFSKFNFHYFSIFILVLGFKLNLFFLLTSPFYYVYTPWISFVVIYFIYFILFYIMYYLIYLFYDKLAHCEISKPIITHHFQQ